MLSSSSLASSVGPCARIGRTDLFFSSFARCLVSAFAFSAIINNSYLASLQVWPDASYSYCFAARRYASFAMRCLMAVSEDPFES